MSLVFHQLQYVSYTHVLQGPPLKLEFSLGSLAAQFGISNVVIPASPPTESYYSPTPYYAPTTTYTPSVSPVAEAFAAGAAAGNSLLAVAYDGYLDQCQVCSNFHTLCLAAM